MPLSLVALSPSLSTDETFGFLSVPENLSGVHEEENDFEQTFQDVFIALSFNGFTPSLTDLYTSATISQNHSSDVLLDSFEAAPSVYVHTAQEDFQTLNALSQAVFAGTKDESEDKTLSLFACETLPEEEEFSQMGEVLSQKSGLHPLFKAQKNVTKKTEESGLLWRNENKVPTASKDRDTQTSLFGMPSMLSLLSRANASPSLLEEGLPNRQTLSEVLGRVIN